jgi:RNA polymerase sigma factor (sigma-70 family)
MQTVPSPARKLEEAGRRSRVPEHIHGTLSGVSTSGFVVTTLGCATKNGRPKCRLIHDAQHEEEQTRQLLSRVAEGNTPAFWTLWDLHKGHLYHLCLWQMGGVREDAEDALSRAMLRALEKLPNSACKIENFRAWLSRLTLNLCVDMHRERRRQVRRLESFENAQPGSNDRLLAADTDSPEQGLINREVFAYVCTAVDDLPLRLREPFVLRFFQEMDYREIADCLILSTDNVRKRIQQARDILREQLNRFLQGSAGHHSRRGRNRSRAAEERSTAAATVVERPTEISRRFICEVLSRQAAQ